MKTPPKYKVQKYIFALLLFCFLNLNQLTLLTGTLIAILYIWPNYLKDVSSFFHQYPYLRMAICIRPVSTRFAPPLLGRVLPDPLL